jgi:hypothetical protein
LARVLRTGRENTLLDVLQLVLPECYPGDQVKPPPQAIIQGVLPPLNTPILWLWYHPRPAWYFCNYDFWGSWTCLSQ